MLTYGDLFKTRQEGAAVGELPEDDHAPFFQKMRQAYLRVARDLKITQGTSDTKQEERREAFKNLPHDTPLSNRATTLLQEAIRIKDELLKKTSSEV